MKTHKKRILFRVDAGGEIGLGHFYRSLNLARLLTRRGYEITYVHKKSIFWEDLAEFEFPHVSLIDSSVNEQMVSICKNFNFDILYVDGIINFKSDQFSDLNGIKKIFYQNISPSRNLADIFILPSIHQTPSFFESFSSSNCRIYQGLKYYMFNEKVENFQPKIINENSEVGNVSIIAGGSDPRDTLELIFEKIEFSKFPHINFTFFYGVDSRFKNNLPKTPPHNVKFSLFNFEKIYKSDLLISAFGVSTHEFMALGMPTLGFGHQKSNANALRILSVKTDAIVDLGLIDDLNQATLDVELTKLISSGHRRVRLNLNCKRILDFKGVERISNIIDEL
jgi:spore coat polysaccharide biosynthesis predicted glycosyltransferase SpsG